jgi:hypothetical protein
MYLKNQFCFRALIHNGQKKGEKAYVGKLFVIALSTITVLMDQVVCMLLSKAKAVI